MITTENCNLPCVKYLPVYRAHGIYALCRVPPRGHTVKPRHTIKRHVCCVLKNNEHDKDSLLPCATTKMHDKRLSRARHVRPPLGPVGTATTIYVCRVLPWGTRQRETFAMCPTGSTWRTLLTCVPRAPAVRTIDGHRQT